ncbi:MAG: hypothetical protein ACYC5O_08090 [Anaerolineae bacterium]
MSERGLPADAGRQPQSAATAVTLRRFPYPYRAAVAICSDVDKTRTLERFLDIQRFLNTETVGADGPGIGLEIGNTFFPYTPDDTLSYFSSRPAERETIRALVQAGYIDCLHSYGDGVAERAQALQALESLDRDGCRLAVWVDHAKAPTNFGKDVTYGSGDVPTSPSYHADATLAYGVRFVWRGRATSITGQETPLSTGRLMGVLDRAHLGRTAGNAAKDVAKVVLGRAGNRRFALHRDNRLLDATALADGRPVYEFKRCNSHWLGLSYGHCSSGLAYVLREGALADLVASGGYTIVYTHLGCGPREAPCLPVQTRQALRRLADRYRSGDIYVTTTSRLLRYHLNRRYLRWSADAGEGGVTIRVDGVDEPIGGLRQVGLADLQGIGFYVPDARRARIVLNGRVVESAERCPADHTGQESITIPRDYLRWPLD